METVCRIPLLSLCLLIAAASLGGAYEGPRLTRCPSGDLTLKVPEDLPEGALLFGWDPDLVVVSSSREAYRRRVGKALNPDASPNTRAFFTGAPAGDDAFSLAPGGQPWAALSRPLPPATPLLRSGDLLTCAPARKPSGPAVLAPAANPVTKFRVHLLLLRVPLRLVAEPRSHAVLPGSPAGTTVARISVFAHGKRVAESTAACAAAAASAGTPALTVHDNGSLTLASAMPDETADRAGRGWSTTVTCEWRGLRARLRLTLALPRLWRRPQTNIRVAVATAAAAASSSSSSPDADDIRAGSSLRLSLAPLLTTSGARRHPPPRVHLLAASHPDRVRLLPAPAPGALLLDLPPSAEPLEVTLEARDSAGRTEVANLTLTSASASIMHGPVSSGWWWPAPLLACAAALALAVPAFCALLLWRRLRLGYAGVKPEFV